MNNNTAQTQSTEVNFETRPLHYPEGFFTNQEVYEQEIIEQDVLRVKNIKLEIREIKQVFAFYFVFMSALLGLMSIEKGRYAFLSLLLLIGYHAFRLR